MDSRKYAAVFVTCSSEKEARRIAKQLLDNKLIACANIINGVKSIFRWKGKIDEAKESLIIMKAAKSDLKDVEKTVKKLHSYEVPEIVALPLVWGSGDYLKWLGDSVK
jgi:periplasmic divalent cation tolerance protein